MERHSAESGKVIHDAPGGRGFTGIAVAASRGEGGADAAAIGEEAIASFPYSITAGLEKGAKNRCVCLLYIAFACPESC